MRENAATKGTRYLAEGRLIVRAVTPHVIEATARGNGEVYRLGCNPEVGWWCACPALGRCAHLIALQQVAVRPEGVVVGVGHPKSLAR